MMKRSFAVLAILFCSCTSDFKLSCYESVLGSIKQERVYREVMQAALNTLPNLSNKDRRRIFKDSSHMDSTRIDDAIFFNTSRSKCLLLVLQKTSEDLKLNQVLIAQGTYTQNKWQFSYDRLPAVPEIIYTVNKFDDKGKITSNSFKDLSAKGRLFVLNAGKVRDNGCDIDYKYWFGE